MQLSFDPSRLSNLYRPAVIMISTYVVIHLVGFFIQHDFSQPQNTYSITEVNISADEFLQLKEPVITPAPPSIQPLPKRKVFTPGQSINPHLP